MNQVKERIMATRATTTGGTITERTFTIHSLKRKTEAQIA